MKKHVEPKGEKKDAEGSKDKKAETMMIMMKTKHPKSMKKKKKMMTDGGYAYM